MGAKRLDAVGNLNNNQPSYFARFTREGKTA